MEKYVLQQPDTLSAQKTAGNSGGEARDRALHPHVKTRGEKKFDWLTYTGIGYFVNVAVSLGAVYWAERTHSGQATLKAIGKGFEKFGASKEAGEFLGRKSFFLTGGFLIMPFMKALENTKVEHVKKYNREIYGAAADTDPVIVRSEQEVAQAPKQSWLSLISGRLLALAPFYFTVGLLWDNGSKLSRLTNPELGAMDKAARMAMQKDNPEAFAKLASKGMYFDRPITNLSRDIGKLAATRGTYFDTPIKGAGTLTKMYRGTMSILGKTMGWLPENQKALSQIESMESQFPGAMQSVKGIKNDPAHSALPYYVISEAITSAMVAWGIYVITRVTGPLFGKKQELPEAKAADEKPVGTPLSAEQAAPAKERPRFAARLEEQQAQPAAMAAR